MRQEFNKILDIIQKRLDKLHGSTMFSDKYSADAETWLTIEKEYILESDEPMDEYIAGLDRRWNQMNQKRLEKSKLFNPIRFITYRDILKSTTNV